MGTKFGLKNQNSRPPSDRGEARPKTSRSPKGIGLYLSPKTLFLYLSHIHSRRSAGTGGCAVCDVEDDGPIKQAAPVIGNVRGEKNEFIALFELEGLIGRLGAQLVDGVVTYEVQLYDTIHKSY